MHQPIFVNIFIFSYRLHRNVFNAAHAACRQINCCRYLRQASCFFCTSLGTFNILRRSRNIHASSCRYRAIVLHRGSYLPVGDLVSQPVQLILDKAGGTVGNAFSTGIGRRFQNNIAAAGVHNRRQSARQTRLHSAAAALYIYQISKIYHAGIQGCRLIDILIAINAYQDIRRPQVDLIRSIDLTQNSYRAAGVQRYLCRRIAQQLQLRFLRIVGACRQHVLHSRHLRRRRRHHMQCASIDNAAAAYSHAVLTQKVQIAADLIVFDSVHRTVDVDVAVNKIDQIIGLVIAVFTTKIHVGDLIGIQAKLLKNIDTGSVDDFFCLYVDNTAISRNICKLSTGNYLCRCHKRISKNTHGSNGRNDPLRQLRALFNCGLYLFCFQFLIAAPDPSLCAHGLAPF